MKLLVKKGKTSKRVFIFIQDSSKSDGSGLTALTSGSSGLVCYRAREDDGNAGATQLSLSGGTKGTWSSGGFVEKDATNQPGVYELGLDNNGLASGSEMVFYLLKGATNMAPCPIEIQLVDFDPHDTVRMGMTALPNAAAEAAGGLYTRGSGAGQISQPANGQIAANSAILRGATAQSGNSSSIKLDASASSTDNLYVGNIIAIISGTGSGQTRTITGYNGSSKQATVDRNWTTSPDGTSIFEIYAADNPTLNATLAVTSAVSKVVIHSGTAQSGSTSNTIKLDTGASATNNLYNGDLITITGGTGVGQTRTIVSYNGTTKIATVDKAWNTTPSSSSTFDIYASTFPTVFSDQGVAQASTSNTITLASTASATSSVYVGSIITILSGTDAGDTAEITAYNGSTKVASIGSTWAVNPDTTSVYAVIPTDSGSGATGGTSDVNVVKWSGSPVSVDANNLPKVDLEDIVGAAVSTTTAQLGVNAVKLGGTTQTGEDVGADTATLIARLTAGRATNLDNLDATVSSRSTYAGADTSGTTTLLSRLTSGRATNLDNLDAAVSSRLATSGYTAPDNADIATLIARLTATRAANLDNLDATVSSRSTYAGADTSGTTTLLSRLTSGRASNLDNLDATISSREPSANEVSASGTASAGGSTSITLAGASATDSIYVGQTVRITGGTGAGQARVITAYVGSTKVATVDRAWQTNPSTDSTFVVILTDAPKTDSSLNVTSNSGGGTFTANVTQWNGHNVSDAAVSGFPDVNAKYLGGTAQTGEDVGADAATLIARLTAGRATNLDNLDAAVSTRLATSGYTAPDNADIATLVARLTAQRATNLDNLDATVSSRSTYAGADTAGTTTLLSRLTSGRATNLDNLDAAVSSRLATSGYTAPDNTDIVAIKAKTDNLPASPAATGDAMTLTSGERTTLRDTIWQAPTSGLTTAASIGKLLVDDIDATISSRSTYAGGDTSGVTTLLSRLTSQRATNLDNLDATVSSRSTYAGTDTAGTTTLLARLTSGRATNLDNLDAAVSTRSTYDGSDTAGTTTLLGRLTAPRAANLDNLDASISGLPTAVQNADALLDRVNGVETNLTPRQWLRLTGAVLLGKVSGASGQHPTFRDYNDTKNRVSAVSDSSGDRLSITYDPS